MVGGPSKELLDQHDVLVGGDSAFQATLRLRQARWRETQGLPVGLHRDMPLGSRLALPYAEETLANYLTPTIRDVVRREVIAPDPQHDKLYGKPRIFNDLLSSQPLCFNLFGELAVDLELASSVCSSLWPTSVDVVTKIDFEWSPGRGDANYLGNKSAFDVVIFHTTPAGGPGFIGIEMKYHENLRVSAAVHKPRYDEVAERSGVFADPSADELRATPLQQIWLDHLLALSMLQSSDGYDAGRFVLMYPEINDRCVTIGKAYEEHVRQPNSFQQVTIETFVAAIATQRDAAWVGEFSRRYLIG